MSADHVMPEHGKRSTREDAIKTFKRLRAISREHAYQVGVLGSTIVKGEGLDQDFVIVAAEGCVAPAWNVATEIVQTCAKRIMAFEEMTDDASSIAVSYMDRSNRVIDILIVGVGE